MTKEVAKFLQTASEECGHECEMRDDYSGRYMYGEKTCGVVVASVAQLMGDAIVYMKRLADDGVLDGVPDAFEDTEFRTDNMAFDYIVY